MTQPCLRSLLPFNRAEWRIGLVCLLVILGSCAGAGPRPDSESAASDFSENLNALYFVDGREGWAVGDQGSLIHTTNGGATWHRRDAGTTLDLHDVYFEDSNNGWIVGEGGLILRTTSAGLGWEREESQTTENLNGVQFLNLNTGWAVGENGTILHTTDGGLLWTLQPGGENYHLNDVHFRDINTGWIVGERGVILFTQEGARGGFWTVQVSGTTSTLNSIRWNGRSAFAVGAGSAVVKTAFGSLGGAGQWLTLTHMMPAGSITDVFFLNPSHGWIANRMGDVLYTDDDGDIWTDRSPIGRTPLNALFFNSPQVGWAVGDEGVIYYTVDGGTFWIRQWVYD